MGNNLPHHSFVVITRLGNVSQMNQALIKAAFGIKLFFLFSILIVLLIIFIVNDCCLRRFHSGSNLNVHNCHKQCDNTQCQQRKF